jgi:basic membrane protein A
MKRSKLLVLVLLVALMLGYVGGTTSARQDQPLKIKLVINGVLGDKSFFDSAQRGMDMLIEDGYNVEVNTIELGIDPAGWETGLSDAMADTEAYDMMIVGTFQMTEFLGARVHLYPDKVFISYDAGVAYDDPTVCVDGCKNVYSVLYAQNEGSFLAGVYAGAMTLSDLDGMNPDPIIGAVGGQDIPVINDFVVGYEQGACLVNPDSQVLVQYAGGWNDPAKGKELALAMYEQKADIVFNIAGGTGVGMFEAAQEQNHYAIGVDSDQATIIADTDPEQAKHILTSMQKNVDMSLYRAVDLYLNGELPVGQAETIGIAEGGVGLSENDIYYDSTPENVLDLIDAATAAVENGDITINTVFADRVDLGYNLVDGIGVPCSDMPATDFDPSMYLGG